VESLTWVHTIDLGDGIVTRGEWGRPHPLILKAFSDIDFTGKRVLDIGCWDGLWSFEAAKRGAREVYATDNVSQRWGRNQATFSLAHKALKSRAQYYPQVSVYDIKEKLGVHDFDVVIFCGIYYHLKNPLLAFARLREVMKDGGTMIVEGEVITDRVESYARFFYHNRLAGDPSNWWVPTILCLREWVECSFFDILNEYTRLPDSRDKPVLTKKIRSFLKMETAEINDRYVLTARATRRKDPNYAYPDDDLRQFDLNEY